MMLLDNLPLLSRTPHELEMLTHIVNRFADLATDVLSYEGH